MILKRLILQGFKSFPDRTEIAFASGMTAIVGPNGSGKSNISDAIRWVLGEQSTRSLRGAKMEDVIFSGTQKRRPVGFAEVSLILDNAAGVFRSDFTEIMVTRRFYRSGESEYYLNRKHCRLKDIHELFMDTGLGRDGYSIIGQGRIDEILSLKSEDRREVFEEAAGVTKFRYRKEEAMRRLEATEENLVRIRDLYAELERQAGPLAEQAEKARAYLVLRDELRVLEVSLWLDDLARIKADRTRATADAAVCAAQLTDTQQAQQALYDRSEQLTRDLREAEVQADTLRRQLRAHEQQRADWGSRCAVLRTELKNNAENLTRTTQEQGRRQEQADALDSQLAAHAASQRTLDAAYAGLTQTAQAQEQACARCSEQIAACQARVQDGEQARSRTEADRFAAELARTAAQTGLSGMDARHETIDADVAAAAARLHEEEQAQAAHEAALAACCQTVTSARNQRAGAAMKAERRRAKVGELTQALASLTAQVNDTERRIGMLREMARDYEGYSRAVKRIMQRQGGLDGVHGPVSDLLTVEERYITAIETALGAAASNLVVDSPAVGKQCIEYLKRTDGGRATFLPLDTIRPAALRESGLDSQRGYCGTADTLVACKPQYQDIVRSLLGRTVVAEDMDAALAIARLYRNRFRIVTLDGQIIQAGGAMTGGSVSKSTGTLARAAQLRTLEDKITRERMARQRAQDALAAAEREAAAADYDCKAIEATCARAQEEEAGLRAIVQQHGALVDSLRTRHAGLVLERRDLAAARAQYETALAEAEEQLTALQAALDAAAHAQEDAQAELDAQQQALDALREQQHQNRTEQAENRSQAAAEQRAAAQLAQLRREMQDGITGSADALRTLEQEGARLRAALDEAEHRQTDGGEEIARLSQRIEEQNALRMRIEGERTRIDRDAQSKNDAILGLERERARLSARLDQLQGEEANILNRMWEHYELTPTPAEQVRVALPDRAAAAQRADGLRAQMRGLGSVNLDAVAAYDKLSERFTFLGEQKADLETARHELQTVIDQLTGRMQEIFAREFARLNHYFGETFREIFGGGHAALELADASDILNCGIEIKVCPPGKAVKTLTLLSGGEKAFVAIALYFAILKVRPTPFCVLDEIEAALDDVNVTRYAQYLRRLSGDTQFIVITHRRGTMEQADMLYGVTMQEQGVSRLLMLNLAEAEKTFGKAIQ